MDETAFATINAATLARIAGDLDRSDELAKAAIKCTQQEMGKRPDDAHSYWLLATLGEAHLLLGEMKDAHDDFAQAVAGAKSHLGNIASMRRNVALLAKDFESAEAILPIFNSGPVVVFSGHMIDAPNRPTPRFPDDLRLVEAVRQAISDKLAELHPVVGYCQGACGSDLLFAEEMLARGAELHLVLPFSKDDFYTTSVDFGFDELSHWKSRFDSVYARATEVHFLTDEPYEFINFTDIANRVQLSNPGSAALLVNSVAKRTVLRQPLGRKVKTLLFADVKGFSAMGEQDAPQFFLPFLRKVSVLLSETEGIEFANTWGDGLFIVFDSAVHGAEFALRLLEQMRDVSWDSLGRGYIPHLRISLHAGPVYETHDGVIGKKNYFGRHVNRAARIEPITAPDCVYATEQVAALLAIDPSAPFSSEYIGRHDLPKNAGRISLYQIIRANSVTQSQSDGQHCG